MNERYAPLDIASHPDNEEVIAEYLNAAAEDDDPHVLITALAEVAKARGFASVAAAASMNHDDLTATLSGDTQPSFETIRAILKGVGVKMAIEPTGSSAIAD